MHEGFTRTLSCSGILVRARLYTKWFIIGLTCMQYLFGD